MGAGRRIGEKGNGRGGEGEGSCFGVICRCFDLIMAVSRITLADPWTGCNMGTGKISMTGPDERG